MRIDVCLVGSGLLSSCDCIIARTAPAFMNELGKTCEHCVNATQRRIQASSAASPRSR